MAGATNPFGQKKVPTNYKEDLSSKGLGYSPGIYIGIVKKNDDPQYMGRLLVWIEEWGGDPDNEGNWVSVSYASPFAGSTSIYEQGENVTEYEDTIKSYGWWAVPPDLETRVLVGFASGNIDKGFWFACLYQRGTQVSIPGIPAKNTYSGPNVSAAPKNKKDKDPDLDRYVEHKPLQSALKRQGLKDDDVRGTSSSSALREKPSKVLGLLTPGQHQFVLDDGDVNGDNRLIRLRTTNGTQILLDDVAGHIYLITKNGENWVELSADGQVHVYGSQSINIHSENNVNIYANNDVNIEAGNSINLKTNLGSINLESADEFNSLAASSTKITSVETSNINSGVAHYETAGVIHMNGPIADPADPIDMYSLIVNQSILESICSVVPEHEPWFGHMGKINPQGHGNQQMKQDPAPDKQPREPTDDDKGAPIQPNGTKDDEQELEKIAATDDLIAFIKQSNGYSPVNVDDAGGQSGGFGSTIVGGP